MADPRVKENPHLAICSRGTQERINVEKKVRVRCYQIITQKGPKIRMAKTTEHNGNNDAE